MTRIPAIVYICLCASTCSKQVSESAVSKLAGSKLSAPVLLDSNVELTQWKLVRDGTPMKVLFYRPLRSIVSKLPVILIGPAGTPQWFGRDNRVNNDEHLPYAQKGFLVAAYSIDGPLREESSDEDDLKAALAFKRSQSGVLNAKHALDFALSQFSNIDPKRIFAVGHSSAGALALNVAASDNRIRAAIAYAPRADSYSNIRSMGDFMDTMNEAMPGFEEWIRSRSVYQNSETIRCPVFIFHARDDSVVPYEDAVKFVNKLKKTNSNVTFTEVPTGNHYDSMAQIGIPAAIKWLDRFRRY